MGASSSVVQFKDQNYKKLRKGCEKSGNLFVDDLLPVGGDSAGVEWLRPGEICERLGGGLRPAMVVDGRNRFDINQGN